MWRVLTLVGVLFLRLGSSADAACPGDCNDNGVVSIDELVSAVRIALAQAALSSCAPADSNADGRVTVDDLVRAVNAALRGCAPTPTATETPTLEATATATPSASAVPATDTPGPTISPTATNAVSATVTPTASPNTESSPTATGTETASVTPTLEAVATATDTVAAGATATSTNAATSTPTVSATNAATSTPTVSATNAATATATPSSTASATATATDLPSASPTRTPSLTATRSPTPTTSPSSTPIPTQTRTATATASPSSTATGGPLGTRRFSLDPASSAFISVLAPNQQVSVTGFTGYLDLQAGVANAQTGRAIINVTGSSTYLQLVSQTGLICIKPLVPVAAAGIVDCNGGTNLGTVIRQDHRIGTVGGGFTAQACTDAGGTVEPGNFPHPQVCNGPLTVEPSAVADSGPGAVAIGPDPTFSINGLPAELTFFESGSQCPGQGPGDGFSAVFVLLSSNTRTEILHESNGNNSLVYDNPGENFSCPAWTQENGPGKLILSFPTLHGAGPVDLINVFVFDD